MQVDRRHVLKGGLATLAALTVGTTAGASGASASRLEGAQSAAASVNGRFPGDPGTGKLYYGASVVASIGGVPRLESQVGHVLGVHRGYFVPASGSSLLRQVADDHSRGRLPHVSTKVPGTWADVAAGRYDSWLRSLLTNLAGSRQPVLLTLHHEPENDTGGPGMAPNNYVAMNTHAIALAASDAPNVTIAPNLMQWTFDPHSGRNPGDWLVPSSKVISTNVYNQWSAGNGLAWTPIGDKLGMVMPWAQGKPFVIGEYGCRTDPTRPGRAAAWMNDAFDWCVAHNVVSMPYFDSDQHSRFGSWILDGERLAAFEQNLNRPEAAWL